MTPALKAMVEAMAKEIERQEIALDSDDNVSPMTLEDLDLEKVARAGLEAIRPADEAVVEAMRETVPADGLEWEFWEPGAQEHWAAMIDAILQDRKEKPVG